MKRLLEGTCALAAVVLLAGCGFASNGRTSDGRIVAVGSESQYADVISQIGGPYVSVTSILKNPSTDPHTFEASPSIARAIAGAGLVVRNGLGYDDFVDQLEQASPSRVRRTISVQALLGKPDDTANPHLWYDPATMPAVARQIAADLKRLDPRHAPTFDANVSKFLAKLQVWSQALADVKAEFPGAVVATTEPVADYLIDAAGLRNATPWSFQSAVMKGADPSPQDIATVRRLFETRQVKVFIYNRQVTDSLTESFASLARSNGIPIVTVTETMPEGTTYQSWMIDETRAIRTALATGRSVTR